MSEEKDRKKSFLILREDFFDNTVGRGDYLKRKDRTVIRKLPQKKNRISKDDDNER